MSLSSFILRYNLEACLRYLWLGFELDLYAPAEVHFVLWYTDYLLAWMTHVMTDARAKIVRHLNEPGGASWGCHGRTDVVPSLSPGQRPGTRN